MISIKKADPFTPAFILSGGTLSVRPGLEVSVGSYVFNVSTYTPVALPTTMVAGTDYAVWASPLGFEASPSFDSAPSMGAEIVGGFHYAPGGNATDVNTGGNATPQISPYSIWDLNFRPRCANARGMVLVADSFWTDIYLLGVDHIVNGTSRNGVVIADGGEPPRRPLTCGGNGVAKAALDWWMANEIMISHGKKLLSYEEACTAFFGAREGVPRGNDPVTTGLATTNTASYAHDYMMTSKWGVIQATGCQWVWGRELGYSVGASPYDGSPRTPQIKPDFYAMSDSRGVLIQDTETATRGALLGGKWNASVGQPGSRCLDWADGVQLTSISISARGRADHWIR